MVINLSGWKIDEEINERQGVAGRFFNSVKITILAKINSSRNKKDKYLRKWLPRFDIWITGMDDCKRTKKKIGSTLDEVGVS